MSLTTFNSQLYDEKTFYQTFWRDLENCQEEVVVESPYITYQRIKTFDLLFERLIKKGVKSILIDEIRITIEELIQIRSKSI